MCQHTFSKEEYKNLQSSVYKVADLLSVAKDACCYSICAKDSQKLEGLNTLLECIVQEHQKSVEMF